MQEIDESIIKKAQNGDNKAFEEIIRTYKQFVANLCFRNLGSQEEAVDMAQDVFCSIFTSLGSFKFQARFSTWIYRVVFNQCANRIKKLAKDRKFFDADTVLHGEDGEREVQIPDRVELPDAAMVSEEMRKTLLESLEKLPDKEKQVYILRELQQLEYSEISSMLGIPLGSVKSRLTSARRTLKGRLIKRLGR